MSRRLSALLVAGLAAAWAPRGARAQGRDVEQPAADGSDITRILAGDLGFEIGGRSTPGGLHVGASYLYRLSEIDWFDAGAGFTFGGGDTACFRDRDDSLVCDHGFASGFAVEAIAAIRRELGERRGFYPFVRGGVALRLISFRGDDLVGFGVPLLLSAGLHREVAERVRLTAAVEIRTGWSVFDRGLGLEPQFSGSIFVGAEFDLD